MTVERQQFPVERTVKDKTGLRVDKKPDHVFAEIRRLRQRVAQLETECSNNRRDIARIEQRLRREALKLTPQPNPGIPELLGMEANYGERNIQSG